MDSREALIALNLIEAFATGRARLLLVFRIDFFRSILVLLLQLG
jgi:hypothetical protein